MMPLSSSMSFTLNQTCDAVAAYRTLTQHRPTAHSLLLESAQPSSRHTQRSLIVGAVHLRATCRGRTVTVTAYTDSGRTVLDALLEALREVPLHPERHGDRLLVTVPEPPTGLTEHRRLHRCSTLTVLRTIASVCSPPDADRANAHHFFLAGVFAYDLVDTFEPIPAPASSVDGDPADAVADYDLVLAAELVTIDHLAGTTTITTTSYGDHPEAPSDDVPAVQAIAALLAPLGTPVTPRSEAAPPAVSWGNVPDAAETAPIDLTGYGTAHRQGAAAPIQAEPSMSDDEFASLVSHLHGHIKAGDVFQIVPSRTFTLPCPRPLDAYTALRALNPSPYLFYAQFPEWTLFGASPESAVTVDGPSRSVEISPIAGTRLRGRHADGTEHADLDSRLETELRLDAKETAEHMMLVDLARNDVARVSEPGSRSVADLLRVDRYSHVMHLVSRVRGRLREGLDALHAYQASMNMGTLTGAPKVRAMQLLRQYEPGRRGTYGGAIGYLDATGTMDTAIVIRSALVVDGVASVRAGAGVVADSVPLAEADETTRKAMAVLRAITLSQGEDAAPHVEPADEAAAEPASPPHVIVLDNLDSFSYNLVDSLSTLGLEVDVYRNDVPLQTIVEAAERHHTSLIVLSPGPGTPEDAGCSIELIHAAAGRIPLLGVCLGHQAIVTAFGGKVGYAGEIVHGRTSHVEHTGHPMFGALPSPVAVARYHSLAAHTVPDALEVTATCPGPDGDIVMGVAHREHPIYGVQFHPESVLTTHGQPLLHTIVNLAHRQRRHAVQAPESRPASSTTYPEKPESSVSSSHPGGPHA